MTDEKKKKRTKRRLVPPLVNLEHWADFRFPRPAQAVAEAVPDYQKWLEASKKWRDTCRESAKEGNGNGFDPPPKPVKLNKGRLTPKQFAAWKEAYNNNQPVDEVFAAYQPLDVEMASEMGMVGIYAGKAAVQKSKPKEWRDEYGEWRPGDFLTGPSQLVDYQTGKITKGFDRQIRICHAQDVRRLIDDAKDNVVTINGVQYGVGTGTADGSIVKITSASMRGSYEAIDVQRMFESTDKLTGLANLVARINSEVETVKLIDGMQIVFLPGQLLTLGYLIQDDKQLTPAQIRKIAAGEEKVKVKFEHLKENDPAMRGKLVPWSDLWKATQVELGQGGIAKLRDRKSRSGEVGNAQKRALDNSLVQMRVHPDNLTPLNLRALQTHVVPFFVADADGAVSQAVAIAYRTNIDLIVTTRSTRAELRKADEAKGIKKVSKPRKPKVEKDETEKTEKKPRKPRVKKSTEVVETVVEKTEEVKPKKSKAAPKPKTKKAPKKTKVNKHQEEELPEITAPSARHDLEDLEPDDSITPSVEEDETIGV